MEFARCLGKEQTCIAGRPVIPPGVLRAEGVIGAGVKVPLRHGKEVFEEKTWFLAKRDEAPQASIGAFLRGIE